LGRIWATPSSLGATWYSNGTDAWFGFQSGRAPHHGCAAPSDSATECGYRISLRKPQPDAIIARVQQQTSYGQIVGQVIRGRRELNGVSLLAMAQSVALATPSGWSRVETGDTAITLNQLRKAARKLRVEPASLVHQADIIAAQLEASGILVHDDKPKNVGHWLLGGAGILALIAAGAAASGTATGSGTKATKTRRASRRRGGR
jgi:transcriptional regulator with XRE-family HTH domain